MPSASVSTGVTVRPSGMCPAASVQCSAGIRNKVAPAARAPASFCRMPPIGPTVPSGSIVPVPAMCSPAARSSSVSLSTMPVANMSPALGPPMSSSVKSMGKPAE